MKAEDVEHALVVERAVEIGEGVGDPARFAVQLAILDVDLAPAGVGQDEPGQPRPDDETDDEEPPVELRVHVARVQGSEPMTPEAASAGGAGDVGEASARTLRKA